ncbi:hypothetical protein vseg_005486 [Gypsophila vaccaria]
MGKVQFLMRELVVVVASRSAGRVHAHVKSAAEEQFKADSRPVQTVQPGMKCILSTSWSDPGEQYLRLPPK